ncbi:MAG: hypothetical protein U1F49_15015 [Rubrivivax sp.]
MRLDDVQRPVIGKPIDDDVLDGFPLLRTDARQRARQRTPGVTHHGHVADERSQRPALLAAAGVGETHATLDAAARFDAGALPFVRHFGCLVHALRLTRFIIAAGPLITPAASVRRDELARIISRHAQPRSRPRRQPSGGGMLKTMSLLAPCPATTCSSVSAAQDRATEGIFEFSSQLAQRIAAALTWRTARVGFTFHVRPELQGLFGTDVGTCRCNPCIAWCTTAPVCAVARRTR